jgi:ribosomal-protein-alanine N-acetyltransferase
MKMAPSKAEFPTLVTERLRLREASMGDRDDFHALISIPEVTRFSNWVDAPKMAQIERSLRWMIKIFPKGTGCSWIIEDRVSGKLLGAIRFNSFDKHARCAELGYELHPSAWGKGLMSEAARAIVRCGFDDFSLNRIEAWTLPGNAASDRVLEKAGFQYEGTLRQKARFKEAFHDFRMFGCLAGDRQS